MEAYRPAPSVPTPEAFASVLRSLSFVYQPIVRWSARQAIAHEALVRSREPTCESPSALFEAARLLDRRRELGRAIRERLAVELDTIEGDVFVNLEAGDLQDPELYDPGSAFGRFAHRVVLEITERAPLSAVPNIRRRVADLRELGFRVAVDDLGSGYAGLASLAVLEPEVVKLDMSLVRDIDRQPTCRHVVRSLTELCGKLRSLVVAEGVETAAERDTLVAMGCDVLQGYLFARPSQPPPAVSW
jgi:EAL domain-containing protein (putative c-di-GMP-specific phosphodiesterase class I)